MAFVLLDIIGGAQHYDFKHSTLVYNAGSIVVLWDVVKDRKTNLIEHMTDVVALKFGKSPKVLYSIEETSICVWNWVESELIQRIPHSLQNCYILESNYIFFIIEYYQEGGYRVTSWDTTNDTLNFLNSTDLDPNAACLGCFFIDANCFATVESYCIKLWSTSVMLLKRIHLSQAISKGLFSSLTRSFVLLTVTGVVVFVSEEVIELLNYRGSI